MSLSEETCCSCFVRFAMPSAMQEQRRKDHKSFFCPFGHSQHYTAETTEEKLRRERDRLTQQLAQKDDEIKQARDAASASEAQAARLHKRVKLGVCPCCNRTFANVARHMKTKHGDNVVTIIANAGT